MVRGRLRFDASRKDRSIPDKKFEFYEVFSAPTAFDTFLLHSVLDCASQRPEDAPETANTQNKKEITMDFKKLYFTLFNTLSDCISSHAAAGPHPNGCGPAGIFNWDHPSWRVFSNAASTAAMQLPRKPCCSSASTPAIVLPPGLQTSSLSCSGCLPDCSTISALPASICAA